MDDKDKHNKAFKDNVLENPMFDAHDRNIIMSHLSNFYCVFQLGYDEGKKDVNTEKPPKE